MRENYLQNKLKTGKAVIGTWAVIPSPVSVDIIASAGLDFIIIDSEHGPISFETAQCMAMACESRSVSPVMRVSGASESEILKALDVGMHCVQVPNITQASQVQSVVEFAKYPPLGKRGFSPFNRNGNYSSAEAMSVPAASNLFSMIAVHVEGLEAIRNIDAILENPALDIVFVGIYDISKSLGVPGEVDHPAVIDTLKTLVRQIDKMGKCAGTIVTDKNQLKRALEYGVRYITYSVDCDHLLRSYKIVRSEFESLTKGN